MMKHIWKQALALLLACGMAAGAAGCGEKKDKAESSAAESSTADSADSIEPVTESDPDNMNYKLTYDKDKVPDELANTIALYFYAVDTQNYDLYLEQINPLYRTSLESLLQEHGDSLSIYFTGYFKRGRQNNRGNPRKSRFP